MTRVIINLISLYQKVFSPDHSFWARHRFPYGYCRFAPSCSEYMKQALARHGLLRGAAKGLWRILRCNPFSAGGFDKVTN